MAEPVSWDAARSARMLAVGLFMSGPVLHLWFGRVGKLIPGRDISSTLKKLVLGNFFFGPAFCAAFFSLNAYAQGERGAQITTRLQRDLIPTLKNGLIEMYNEYGEAVCELHKKLLAIISEELGQAPDFLSSKLGHEKALMRTMFNYYPPCPQPELVMGTASHADACALTKVQQKVLGLQVLHDGVWVPALTSSSDHAFVLNISDSLQIVSNGRFKSVLHRAVVHNTSRISIPNFLALGVVPSSWSDESMASPSSSP